jgi:hypothetical protein
MNYDINSVGHELEEGEISHWMVRDISGVLTGVEYEESGMEYGPYQFDGFHFWHIYPTRWKIDVYDAVYSMKQNGDKADRDAKVGKAVELALNYFLDEKRYKVQGSEIWAKATELGGIEVTPVAGGKVLSAYGIEKKQNSKGKWIYDLSVLLEVQENEGLKAK